jgi:hypothetical protein
MWHNLRETLRLAGMQLKDQSPIGDLWKGNTLNWLGFSIGRTDGGLRVRIAAKSWSRLYGKLVLAHEKPNAPLHALAAINGWVDQLGPCYEFEDHSVVLDRIAEMAASQGFDEIPTRGALRERWRRAHQRWLEIRQDVIEPPPAKVSQPALPPSNSDDSSPPFNVDEGD